jgi:hypothetical protein
VSSALGPHTRTAHLDRALHIARRLRHAEAARDLAQDALVARAGPLREVHLAVQRQATQVRHHAAVEKGMPHLAPVARHDAVVAAQVARRQPVDVQLQLRVVSAASRRQSPRMLTSSVSAAAPPRSHARRCRL